MKIAVLLRMMIAYFKEASSILGEVNPFIQNRKSKIE
jgi:hypothetical protein